MYKLILQIHNVHTISISNNQKLLLVLNAPTRYNFSMSCLTIFKAKSTMILHQLEIRNCVFGFYSLVSKPNLIITMHTFRFISLVLLFMHFPLIGQEKIDAFLLEKIQHASPNERIKVRIEFTEKYDVSQEKNRLIMNQVAVKERAKVILSGLFQTAEQSQSRVQNFLKDNPQKFSNIQNYWIANVLFCEANAEAIENLTSFAEIDKIYFENNRFELGDVFVQEEHIDVRGPGGTEPSIEACNVRPLWELGYTGRGRTVFVYDTGVWPTHPTFVDRFIGNRTYLNEAWYGFYHFEPNGERNSHGTHVLGTMVGLDETTADSIGIAMNAYWIANDHVGPTISVMPDLPYLMAAYQWALNPDNDFNTTEDIPDVFNNSFRWYDGADQQQCEGIVVDLMIAIEAAGVANIYSGGNQGPNNTTISAPQRINVSEVNTFSVGSVNGNAPFPHPLSSFSSLGPKQCPGTGSLSIHPEVVAPGQNVRSAWGQNEYNTISGTSMAAPHVSGVALLLKEAFPNLSGEDILWAIYLTAIDLGEPGEDNVYGMGMIDAHAAFLYLAENYVPANPNQVDFDLAVESIQGVEMNAIYCDNDFTLSAVIKNKGLQTIESFTLSYGLSGTSPQTQSWSGSLAPGQSTTIALGAFMPSSNGQQEFWVKAELPGNIEHYDLINNKRHVRWNVRPTLPIPFIEEFENGWNNGLWTVHNPDASFTWRTTRAPFHHNENRAATIQLTNYNPAQNQRDELQSPFFVIPQIGEITMDFDLCYRRRSGIASHQDTLRIFLQKYCAGTRDTLTTLAGESLAVIPSPNPNFTPQSMDDWKKLSFDLSDYYGQEIQIVFESTNRAGNHIYLDNFRIFEAQNPPLGIPHQNEPEITIYPNPSKEKFVIEINNVQFYQPISLSILNIFGQKIEDMIMTSNRYLLDLNNQASGVYFVVIHQEDNTSVHRIVKYE